MNDAFTQYVAAVKPIHPDHPVTSIPRSVGDALARELEAARAIVSVVRSNCSHNYHGEDCPYGTDEDGNELEPSKWDTGEECECGLIEIQELLKAYDAVRSV